MEEISGDGLRSVSFSVHKLFTKSKGKCKAAMRHRQESLCYNKHIFQKEKCGSRLQSAGKNDIEEEKESLWRVYWFRCFSA